MCNKTKEIILSGVFVELSRRKLGTTLWRRGVALALALVRNSVGAARAVHFRHPGFFETTTSSQVWKNPGLWDNADALDMS
jgi:hypothetical protein